MAKAYFAAGCFWGVQQRFSKLPGVTNTTVGYMGGTMHSPDYRSVCTGQTGHAEVVEVEYDAAQIDFATLMSCFFEWHDPTQVNRQGPDIGTQYRTAIFPQNNEQRTQAQKKIDQLNQSDGHSKPIATTIETADKFWPAEDYHQHYLDKRGLRPLRDLTMARVLVTGGRTGIGQAVLTQLIDDGHVGDQYIAPSSTRPSFSRVVHPRSQQARQRSSVL